MSKRTKPHEDEELAESEANLDARDESSETSAGEPPTDETELERSERERGELLASWQRAQADYQNLKRRTALDIEAAIRHAGQGLLHDFLLVLDNLDMALSTPCTTDEAKNLLVGVKMTRDQMLKAFERNDLEPIAAEGMFDPAVHQAVATIATDEVEPGTILEVVRTGWMHMGTALRHAHVKVATHPEDRAPRPTGAGRCLMPTYDYHCKACGNELEIFHSMTDAPKRKCPECGALKLEREIGTGGGIIFKGGGFYETDYRSSSYKQGAEAEKKAKEPKSSDSKAKADTKKPEPKKKKSE